MVSEDSSKIVTEESQEEGSRNRETEIDIKLLYVAITRAMSALDIYYIGKIARFF